MRLLDAACLSYLSYSSPVNESEVIAESFPLPTSGCSGSSKRMDKFVRDTLGSRWNVLTLRLDSKIGYQCIKFANHEEKIFAFVYRGTVVDFSSEKTVMEENIKCDIRILESVDSLDNGEEDRNNTDKLNDPKFRDRDDLLINLCRKSTEYAKTDYEFFFGKYSRYPDYTIVHIGHSLGGFLAEFVSCFMTNWKNLLNNGCITFDSLGTEPFLPRFGITKPLNNFNFHFFECPNIANTANHHVGTRYQVGNVPYKPQGHNSNVGWVSNRNSRELLTFMHYHRLETMIDLLQAKTVKIAEIEKWPVAHNHFLDASSLNRSHSSRSIFSWWNRCWGNDISEELANAITGGVVEFTHIVQGEVKLQPSHSSSVCRFQIGHDLCITEEVK